MGGFSYALKGGEGCGKANSKARTFCRRISGGFACYAVSKSKETGKIFILPVSFRGGVRVILLFALLILSWRIGITVFISCLI